MQNKQVLNAIHKDPSVNTLTRGCVMEIIWAYRKIIYLELKTNGHFRLNGIGDLQNEKMPARTYRNQPIGEVKNFPEKRLVRFKAAASLLRKVNECRVENNEQIVKEIQQDLEEKYKSLDGNTRKKDLTRIKGHLTRMKDQVKPVLMAYQKMIVEDLINKGQFRLNNIGLLKFETIADRTRRLRQLTEKQTVKFYSSTYLKQWVNSKE